MTGKWQYNNRQANIRELLTQLREAKYKKDHLQRNTP